MNDLEGFKLELIVHCRNVSYWVDKLQRTHNGCDKQILRANAGTLSSNRLDNWFREMSIFSNHQKHFVEM